MGYDFMQKKLTKKIGWAACIAAVWALSGCAPVTVSSWPEGARVYCKEDGKLLGTTPVNVNLFANDKEVVIRKDGYFSKTVMLSPIDSSDRNVALRYRNQVVLTSTPTGAELFIEGQDAPIGRTPFLIDYSQDYRKVEARISGYIFQQVTIPEDPEGNVNITLQRQPTVTVVSKPYNVEVYNKNGERMGVTPLDVLALDAIELELKKDGYFSRTVSVGPETGSPHTVELEREPTVIVYSQPEGATVIYRGVTLGKTPYRHFVQKDMDLELVYDRYYTKQIMIAPDSPRKVMVKLKAKPYITINSTPVGASLYRSGGVELIGKTPVEMLVEKDTALEMHKPGFDIKPFILSSGSAQEVSVPLISSVHALEKTVRIDSSPSGALVYRPGGAELIGTTPMEQRVRSERNFELQLDGFKTKIVTVAPDSAGSIVFALARDESSRNATISDPLLNTPSSF